MIRKTRTGESGIHFIEDETESASLDKGAGDEGRGSCNHSKRRKRNYLM